MTYIIRQERADDYLRVEQVVEKAFQQVEMTDHTEHHLVKRIRQSDAFIPELSLVAVFKETDEIIGHVLCSKITIKHESQNVNSLALAPVSVLPPYQHKGIGRSLIQTAIQIAKALQYESMIVLGHPAYYPKFGFEKTSKWDIQAAFDVPEEALMALELQEDALKGISGTIVYPNAFFE